MDVAVPTELQVDVSPHNAMYNKFCTKNKMFRNRNVFFLIYLNFLYFLFTNICACAFWDRFVMSEIINLHVANKCPIVTYAYAIYRIRTDKFH